MRIHLLCSSSLQKVKYLPPANEVAGRYRLCPRGSLSGGSLSGGFLSRGLYLEVSVRGSLLQRPPIMVEDRAVRILLECILVFDENEPVVSHIVDRKELECQNLGSGTLLLL